MRQLRYIFPKAIMLENLNHFSLRFSGYGSPSLPIIYPPPLCFDATFEPPVKIFSVLKDNVLYSTVKRGTVQ